MSSSAELNEAVRRTCVLYLRVSSMSQVETGYDPEGLSIKAQRDICRNKAESLGLAVIGEYVELGRSGTNVQGRPEYQGMMQRVTTQRDVDFIMVYQLSRLNRNRTDDAMVMLQMEAAGAKLLSATETSMRPGRPTDSRHLGKHQPVPLRFRGRGHRPQTAAQGAERRHHRPRTAGIPQHQGVCRWSTGQQYRARS